jgi:hypothetical protein
VTYLNHDHRKREDICFLAMRPLTQDLWRGPSCRVTALTRGTLYGIQGFSDRREAKIRNACMAGVVHKYV